jgi:hypothetical protein
MTDLAETEWTHNMLINAIAKEITNDKLNEIMTCIAMGASRKGQDNDDEFQMTVPDKGLPMNLKNLIKQEAKE